MSNKLNKREFAKLIKEWKLLIESSLGSIDQEVIKSSRNFFYDIGITENECLTADKVEEEYINVYEGLSKYINSNLHILNLSEENKDIIVKPEDFLLVKKNTIIKRKHQDFSNTSQSHGEVKSSVDMLSSVYKKRSVPNQEYLKRYSELLNAAYEEDKIRTKKGFEPRTGDLYKKLKELEKERKYTEKQDEDIMQDDSIYLKPYDESYKKLNDAYSAIINHSNLKKIKSITFVCPPDNQSIVLEMCEIEIIGTLNESANKKNSIINEFNLNSDDGSNWNQEPEDEGEPSYEEKYKIFIGNSYVIIFGKELFSLESF